MQEDNTALKRGTASEGSGFNSSYGTSPDMEGDSNTTNERSPSPSDESPDQLIWQVHIF